MFGGSVVYSVNSGLLINDSPVKCLPLFSSVPHRYVLLSLSLSTISYQYQQSIKEVEQQQQTSFFQSSLEIELKLVL